MRDITLITGCMFSGKTTKLIEFHQFSDAEESEKITVKPLIDTRYKAGHVQSHSGLSLPGHRIGKPEELYPLIESTHKELYIDEIQFFPDQLTTVLLDLSLNGLRIYCAGLDKNYLGEPYSVVDKIKPMAGRHLQLKAHCAVCGAPAGFTFRTVDSDEPVFIGHHDAYEARCEIHWKSENQ